eukprot:251121-Pyramimonas_sp.AAC.1
MARVGYQCPRIECMRKKRRLEIPAVRAPLKGERGGRAKRARRTVLPKDLDPHLLLRAGLLLAQLIHCVVSLLLL